MAVGMWLQKLEPQIGEDGRLEQLNKLVHLERKQKIEISEMCTQKISNGQLLLSLS